MRRDMRITKEPLVMIIPMIDIMLFLLVFFMISTIYMVQTNTVQVALPQAAAAKMETRPNIVPITVTQRGDVLFDKDELPNQEIEQKVRDALAADADTVFVLRGDAQADYEDVVHVLDILKRAGTRHVSIATETKR
ncbi:biopolymer transporter ExbD [Selenomonas sp. TAMA-11512]|uniref:ExbD/TolR family protein n=1 Tax=Selenomonas sp. TAMA-11512 TaxID=3095337 RepID=UPI00308C7F6E|nr:biopolymer transporter ExbD [Selenomonas sp. TAMA-11512]